MYGCRDDTASRHAYHVMRARGIFGDTQRITVTASPGSVRVCPGTEDVSTACVRAGAPFSSVRVANGNILDAVANVSFQNVGTAPHWATYLEPLRADEAQDQRCVRDQLGPIAGTSVRLGDEMGVLVSASVPACSALVFVGIPADTGARDPYRIALLGGGKVRVSELSSFVARLRQGDTAPDFIYFLDLPILRNASAPLDALETLMDEQGVPWSVVFSPASERRGFESFVDVFGSLDYVSLVHGVPLIVLDTASAGLSAPQRADVDAMRSCGSGCAPAVALMSIPPVSTHRLDVGMFGSQAQGQELVSRLTSRGTRHVVSSTESTRRSARFSRMTLTDVGELQLADTYLELRIDPPAARALLCDEGISLQSNSTVTVRPPVVACDLTEDCVGGICLRRCTTGAACAVDARCDAAGYCRRRCESGCPAYRCRDDGFCDDAPGLQLGVRPM